MTAFVAITAGVAKPFLGGTTSELSSICGLGQKFRILFTRSFVGRKTGRPSETPRSSKRAEPL